jgi:hypothetical protein
MGHFAYLLRSEEQPEYSLEKENTLGLIIVPEEDI